MKNAAKPDLYQTVTDRIVAALEAGTKPWSKPWAGGASGAQRRSNGAPYRGINQLLLTLTSSHDGYASPYWLTFKQAIDLGGNVRKGEKSTEIVFYKPLTVKDKHAPAGEDRDVTIPLLRSYRVFNADQCDGLPERFRPAAIEIVAGKQRDEEAERALRSSGATIREGGGQAFYSPGSDVVQMPPFDAFETVGGFLATLAHELIHWTGHKSRLDRLSYHGGFGSQTYAREELVAEIGAAFTCARLGVAGEHHDNHAAYVASWLKTLRDDKRAIFVAAAKAQTACDLVLANAELADGIEEAGEGEGEPAIAAPVEPAPIAEPAFAADLFAAA